ncbi:MAG: hypothetical protein AB7L71_05950 [Vicinamibacterales bacterium]
MAARGGGWWPAMVLLGAAVVPVASQGRADVLTPSDGLSQQICDRLLSPVDFVQDLNGRYLLLDRRQHTVYAVDRTGQQLTQLVQAGMKEGEALQPAALALAPDGSWAVSDAPFRQERLQVFTVTGAQLRAFLRPTMAAPRLALGPVILNGVGGMQFTGDRFIINAPETGALVSELDLDGNPVRQIGQLRASGHESDRNLHLAMNLGVALRGADGTTTFVFQTGRPLFRKYDADGQLLYERHIEGSHLDPYVQAFPTTWPTRKSGDGVYPIVPATIRTAALDPQGNLWVSLAAPYTYVYDTYGDKIRTVRFDGTGGGSPESLSFSHVPGVTRALVLPGCYTYEIRM